MPHAIPLPARLDVGAACALWDQISRAEGDLLLDAAQLDHLGAAGLQVLLVAQRRQNLRGQRFALVNAGPECLGRLAQLGGVGLIPCATAGDFP